MGRKKGSKRVAYFAVPGSSLMRLPLSEPLALFSQSNPVLFETFVATQLLRR
jgi:hypothetical protein